jgi:Tol biopolymer transport system component
MLTGRLPFTGDYDQAVIQAIQKKEHTAVSSLRSEAMPELDWIANKALAKDPQERYQTAQEMSGDLQAVQRKLQSPAGTQEPTWVSQQSRRRWLLALAALLLAGVVGIVVRQIPKWSDVNILTWGKPREVTSSDSWEGQPSLSPDGGLIAYVSDQSGNLDIFLVDTSGGNSIQLTDHAAADSEPAWFPDGNWLAFVSDRWGQLDIWKVGPLGGGAAHLVRDGRHPAISPDGQWIAFSRIADSGRLRIVVAPLSDVDQGRLVTDAAAGLWDHRYPAWSPDGKQLCYAAQDGLYIVPATGGTARRLTSPGKGDSQPVWSSNGRHVYFSSNRGGTVALWRVPAKGGEPKRLTMGSGLECDPTVTRDGSMFAYATQADDYDMILCDRTTGQEKNLPSLFNACYAVIAPQNDRIVFVSKRGGTKTDLWIQELQDGAPVGSVLRLTDQPGNAACPVFSPDGGWVAYYCTIEGQRDIWTVPAAGGQPLRFTDDPAVDIHPAWSPNGDRLAFVSERAGTSDIWLAPIAQGRPAGPAERLTQGDVGAYYPAWSSDGRWIVFVGNKHDRNEVWRVPVDGSAQPQQLTEKARAFQAIWDELSGTICASGAWGGNCYSLRTVSTEGEPPRPIQPPVDFDPLMKIALFNLSANGRFLIYPRAEFAGNIWVIEASKRRF